MKLIILIALHLLSCANGLSFSLTSPTSGEVPFSLGHAFNEGYIPQDAYIIADIPSFQAEVKSRWPDGSVKFAFLSGIASLTANEPKEVILSATSSAPSTSPLTEQDLLEASVSASISFTPFGTVQLSSLINTESTFDSQKQRFSAGRVRQWVSGSEMSSWIYYSPIGSDPHLAAWFEVQLFRTGAIDVLAWIENGYLNVAGPTSKNGTITFSLGGTQRFLADNFTLPHHTRVPLAPSEALFNWRPASTPIVDIKINTTYLQDTRLVPSYRGVTSADSSLLDALAQTYTPHAQGNYSPSMGMTGYHGSIGLLPYWDAFYFTSSGATKARRTVIIHGLLAGRYGIHYRDEKTNTPVKFSDYPNLVIIATGGSTKSTYTPAPSGTNPQKWATSHHPSIGYLAYLLTGRFYFMEQIQFPATHSFLISSDNSRNFTGGVILSNAGTFTTRGAAWALRTVIQAFTATPDGDVLQQQLANRYLANLEYYHNKYIARQSNPMGFCHPYSDYDVGGAYMTATWMEDFLTAAWGYSIDLQLPLSAAQKLNLKEFFDWKSRSIVGRLGRALVDEYYFVDAAPYIIAAAPSDTADWETGTGPWFNNWGEIYAATIGVPSPKAPLDDLLRGAYFPEPTSYWGNMQPALSYSVQHDAPGARVAFERITGAPNWNQLVTGFNTAPVWGVQPHRVPEANTAPLAPRPDSPPPGLSPSASGPSANTGPSSISSAAVFAQSFCYMIFLAFLAC